MSDEFVELLESLFACRLPVIIKSNGGSMRPTIPKNSYVRLEAASLHSVKLGDIVVYVQDDTHTVMHRVVRKSIKDGARYVQTWGDNMSMPDSPVLLSRVKARVTGYQQKNGQWISIKRSRWSYIRLFLSRYCWYWLRRLFDNFFRLLKFHLY